MLIYNRKLFGAKSVVLNVYLRLYLSRDCFRQFGGAQRVDYVSHNLNLPVRVALDLSRRRPRQYKVR